MRDRISADEQGAMPNPHVLLYSPGLGYIRRGLETFTQELYEALQGESALTTTLCQSTENVLSQAIPIWAPKRNSDLYQAKVFQRFQPKSYRIENFYFSLFLTWICYTKSCDIVHFSETIPANVLFHLRNRIGGSFQLLFSNGGPALPKDYCRYDYVQVLTPDQKQEALQFGYPEHRLFLVPYGLNCQVFSKHLQAAEKDALRQQLGLPRDRVIVLSVGAINASHKRMDWLVEAFSTLDPTQFFLWIVGQSEAETKAIQALAAARLCQGSYRFDSLPYDQMPTAYAVADYFVLCSLQEGFGRVYLEAMAAGLPIIAHRNATTEWILGEDSSGLVDLTKQDNLRDALVSFEGNYFERESQQSTNQTRVFSRFDWGSLKGQYIQMYQQILEKNGCR